MTHESSKRSTIQFFMKRWSVCTKCSVTVCREVTTPPSISDIKKRSSTASIARGTSWRWTSRLIWRKTIWRSTATSKVVASSCAWRHSACWWRVQTSSLCVQRVKNSTAPNACANSICDTVCSKRLTTTSSMIIMNSKSSQTRKSMQSSKRIYFTTNATLSSILARQNLIREKLTRRLKAFRITVRSHSGNLKTKNQWATIV